MAISEDTAPRDAPPTNPTIGTLNPTLSLICFAVAAAGMSWLNVFLGEWVRLPKFGTVAGHLISVLYLATVLFLLMRAAEAATRLRVSTAFLILTGIAFAAPVFISILSGVSSATVSNVFASLAGILEALPYIVRFCTSNLLGPIGMVLIGAGIGRVFKHPNTLLAGAGFAIFFDLVVVTMGTVAQLMKSNSNVISLVSVGAGGSGGNNPPSTFHHHGINPLSTVTIGPADVLFIAVFLGAVSGLRLANRATFFWMYGLLLTALILVESTALPIPALVPMGIAVLIANIRFAAFTKTEKRDLAIGGAFALFCAALMIAGARRFLPTPAPAAPQMHYGFEIGHMNGSNAIIVSGIVRDSVADKGGLRPGDEILAIDGTPAASVTEDALKQDSLKPVLELQITRPGATKPLDLTLRAVQ